MSGTTKRIPKPLGDTRGFTLVELLMYMLISSTVVAAVFGVLINQSRYLRGQVEVKDVRETLRGAVALLSTDLRHVSAERGDLYAIGAQSITLRSYSGSGVVCGVDAAQPRFGLWRPRGAFGASSGDSVMALDSDSGWVSAATSRTWTSGGGVGCAWSVAHQPDLVVQAGDTTLSVAVGSVLQAFRQVEYGIFEWDGRWWLGRKVSGASQFELLTGPLARPTDGGLGFRYFKADGGTTGNRAAVARVEIALRGQSQRAQPVKRDRTTSDRFASDSVITTVLLRN